MFSLPRPFRSDEPTLRTLDSGNRIVGFRVKNASDTLAEIAVALDARHPHRQAALDACSLLAAHVAQLASGADRTARRRQRQARLVLTIADNGIRIEARGPGIDRAAPDTDVGGSADRWGKASHRDGTTLWCAIGNPIDGEEALLQ